MKNLLSSLILATERFPRHLRLPERSNGQCAALTPLLDHALVCKHRAYDPVYKFLGGALAMQGYTIGPQVVDNTDQSRVLYAEGQTWVHEGS